MVMQTYRCEKKETKKETKKQSTGIRASPHSWSVNLAVADINIIVFR